MYFNWQSIAYNGQSGTAFITLRAAVPGGWVVRNISWQGHSSHEAARVQSESMVFVPDIGHTWYAPEIQIPTYD